MDDFSEDKRDVLEALSDESPAMTEAEVSDLADNYGRFQPRFVLVKKSDNLVFARRLSDLILLSSTVSYQTSRNCTVPEDCQLFEILADSSLKAINE